MKKTLLFVFTLLVSGAMFAQLPVSTTSANRNVLLEEFTGIYCTYCPDGHLRANNFAAANPGKVCLINIHTGGYAVPTGSDPNFQTKFGAAIAAQTGLTGYPAGTINRHVFAGLGMGTNTTAMSRGNWVTAGNQILALPSYVNVAHADTINISTRELKVKVEAYFTGSTAPSQVFLNLAVVQDNVEGPQTGMSSNPAQVLPNGKYNHMHMLRTMLTGQWGEAISTTTQGTLVTRTYTYTIPTDTLGIPFELGNLKVIAFITETQQEVVTASEAPMNYYAPAGISICDLSATQKMTIPGMCDYTAIPKVMIKNLSTVNADTFNVKYQLNGGTAVSQTIHNTLLAGDSVLITFPSVTVAPGANKFDFYVDFNGVNHLIDMVGANSMTSTPKFFTISSTPFDTKFAEGFESSTSNTSTVPHTIAVNPSGSTAVVIDKSLVSGLTTNLGGYGASNKSFFWYFYNMSSGTTVSLVYEKINCSANTGYGMKFNYAYAQYSTENDELKIDYSTNCGSTWTNLYDKKGSALATAPANGSSSFWPTATQWKSENVDMSVLDGKSDVMIRISGISDYGNNLFLDDIQLYNNTNVGIELTQKMESVNIYPNPAQNNVNINMELLASSSVKVEVYNVSGQLVATENFGELTSGNHTLNFNTEALVDGVYTMKVVANDNVKVSSLVIKK